MNEQNMLKFVLIDDDHINNFLVKGILKLNAPEVIAQAFTNPKEALNYLLELQAEDFQNLIILLDINMPVLNGWDVLDKLTAHFGNNLPANAKVYMLTSSSMDDDKVRSESYKLVAGFLTKPLKLIDLEKIQEKYS